ncbi:unnamed protein product [Didymodactylos carnosus]|uniref:Uncharacterized protein n=1 Tax=Didymodactylos carnosus TaxID=1234261 RepID=A0A8S2K6T0_9BILA|nr:unnamed protein product [Didymodactylos carnosus]CAF3837153.1 unnamed protein product [Didymodactylos carnosus]
MGKSVGHTSSVCRRLKVTENRSLATLKDIGFIIEFYLMDVFIVVCELNALATFDDISGGSSNRNVMPNDYSGLVWTNAVIVNDIAISSVGCTGYCLIVINSPMVIRPDNGTTFILNSCILGAPLGDQNATIKAYYFATLLNTTTVSLTLNQSMTFAPDWPSVTSVTFESNMGLTVDNISVTLQDTCASGEYFIQFETHLTFSA